MINLLLEENTKRNEGEAVFPEYVGMIYDECVIEGIMENDSDEDKFYAKEEKALLKRLEKYKENYLMWTYNEDIPFSNNVKKKTKTLAVNFKTKNEGIRTISKHTECKILCTDKKLYRNRKKDMG